MAAGVFEILCGFLAILILLYYYLTANFNYWKSRGVNGPKPIPIFGNIADFFLGKICLGDCFKKIYEQYPNEPVVGLFLKGEPVLMLRDPEYIKHVLIKDFTVFPDRHQDVYEKAEPLSVHLFRIDSSRWRPLRTRLSPVFTSGKLKEMFHLLLECSEHFEKYLDEVAKEGIVECRDLTAKFTTDVIGSCAFGIEINAMNNENNEFRKMGNKIFTPSLKMRIKERFRETAPWLFERVGHFLDNTDVVEFMTNIAKNTIEYRKQNNIHRPDCIDVLIDFKDYPEKLAPNNVTDAFIAAQLMVFFAAGFETSSNTISNAMYELALNQSMQEQLREEIREVLKSTDGAIFYDTVKQMPYLDKVFRETLRKYPPVMYLARRPVRNYTFQGTKVTVQKGQKVFIPIYAIQNDPNIYPNPDVFDPERFSDENMKMRNSMYYLPFGDGPRNCIGARFAVYQVKIGLIKILLNYNIDVCEKTQIPYILHPHHSMMLQPFYGLHVKLTKLS